MMSNPEKDTNEAVKTCLHLYQELYKYHYGNLPRLPSYGAVYTTFKRLLQRYTMPQLGCMIFMHFEWRGMTGEADGLFDRAYEAGFPLNWFYNNVGQYETFLMANDPTARIWGLEYEVELTKYLDSLCEMLFSAENALRF